MSETSTSGRARLVFDQNELNYNFGLEHPMQPDRLRALLDLLETSGLWQRNNERQRLPFQPATLEQLRLVHTSNYIAAVQQLGILVETGGNPEDATELTELALQYGFGEGDTPVIPNMHEVSALIAGGTLAALSAVMGLPEGGTFSEDERPVHAFHPAGGLHHAWADRASGFCIYNDIGVAIAHVLDSTEAKILYLDFDAHHGDGVQRMFYDEPRVMTVSFHETGRYLFPGTGDVLELGKGAGRGYSINVPLEPFTEDDSFIEVLNTLVPPLALSFAPDVIVSAHGCDTHAWDPLTHLEMTLRSMEAQAKLVHQLAHTYCKGRWVAVGSGGYDPYRVVPRGWGMIWAVMSGQPLPERLPEEWVKRWEPAWQKIEVEEELAEQAMGKEFTHPVFPTTFRDWPEDFPAQPRRMTINHSNMRTATLVRQLVVPPPVRHVFPTPQRRSPMADLFDLLHVGAEEKASRSKIIQTPKGEIFLRDFCPPSLVERLRVDDGLHAFTRFPEREHELLLNIAKSPDCEVTLAHTHDGVIVGQVTLAPCDDWWQGFENVYEVSIEVSSNWRGAGIAHHLLAFALELEALEDMILFAMGLSWHWDTEGMGIPVSRYRKLIARLFGSQGFVEQSTTAPDISMEPGNIFLVRIGKRVDEHTAQRFLNRVNSIPEVIRV